MLVQVTPIISDEGVSYLYVQYSNLYLLIVSRENVNAASMLLFLHKLREVFVHYFNELEEESLRDNFVIAYELLDEVRLCFACAALVRLGCRIALGRRRPHVPLDGELGLHVLLLSVAVCLRSAEASPTAPSVNASA